MTNFSNQRPWVMTRSIASCLCSVIVAGWAASPVVVAEDWRQFLGPRAAAAAPQAKLPLVWNDDQNILWKARLPGAGSSSPIVVDDKVLATVYRGDSTPTARELLCFDRHDGRLLWSASVDAKQPEDPYRGYITEHGYASSTPVSDGQQVFAFFGKSGVVAFDMQGNQQWQVDVGSESSNRQWGSAASLIVYQDTVIVNASEESQSIRALDKATGEERWKAEAGSLELAYGTPTLVELTDGRTELVIGVPGEVWGLNPDTGKLNWYAETRLTGNICPSIVAGPQDVIYVFGGYRSSGSHAIRAGGSGDVSQTHVLWTSRNSSYVATPLLHAGHLYWIDDRGLAFCANADTGDLVYRERLDDVQSGGRPFYGSPVLAGDRWIVFSRRSGAFVLSAKPEFEQLAHNILSADESDFNATPALSEDTLFIRSNEHLYCISSK